MGCASSAATPRGSECGSAESGGRGSGRSVTVNYVSNTAERVGPVGEEGADRGEGGEH